MNSVPGVIQLLSKTASSSTTSPYHRKRYKIPVCGAGKPVGQQGKNHEGNNGPFRAMMHSKQMIPEPKFDPAVTIKRETKGLLLMTLAARQSSSVP